MTKKALKNIYFWLIEFSIETVLIGVLGFWGFGVLGFDAIL